MKIFLRNPFQNRSSTEPVSRLQPTETSSANPRPVPRPVKSRYRRAPTNRLTRWFSDSISSLRNRFRHITGSRSGGLRNTATTEGSLEIHGASVGDPGFTNLAATTQSLRSNFDDGNSVMSDLERQHPSHNRVSTLPNTSTGRIIPSDTSNSSSLVRRRRNRNKRVPLPMDEPPPMPK